MALNIEDPTMRGGFKAVSDAVKAEYLKLTNRKLTSKELRLLPYLRYRAHNGGYLERRTVNADEWLIIDEFCEAGLMVMNKDHKIGITATLFAAINLVEWDVYCIKAVADE